MIRRERTSVGITDDRRQRDGSWDATAIRRLRRHAQFSQQQLAEQLNARQQTISEWERGEYTPRGTAARLLTRVAEDVEFPFEAGPAPADEPTEANVDGEPRDA
jgi:DNA-binding transcriptional regulator YiaG